MAIVLYVCDSSNKRIQILTEDLIFLEPLQLDFQPLQVVVFNNTLCIRNYNSFICFYSLNPFTLRYKYDRHDGLVSFLNTFFFEYNESNKKFYCFDEFGCLTEEVDIPRFKQIFQSDFEACSFHLINDSLYLISIGKKELLKFELKRI